MEELRRQAGWAKTFGLPLELISAEEAQEMFPLMSTDGVLGAAWLPTDGYLDPSQLTYALADGARRGGCRDLHPHAGHRDRGRRTAGCAAVETETGPDRGRGRRQRRRDVRGRDRAPGRRARAGDPDVAPVPGHAAVPRARRRRPAADPARPRPARLLPRGGRRPGDGRLRAPLEPAFLPDGTGGLRPDPARLQRPAARGRLGPLRGDRRELEAPGPGDGRGHGHEADQRPRGVHARQRVLPRRDRGARASSSPPASARTAWPARAGSAR